MLNVITVFVLSYLLGSIPTSIITGKVLRGIDIREHGSGNAGGTNVFRVLGWKPGLFVMIADTLKGFIATYFVSRLAGGSVPLDFGIVQLIAGCAAIAGHIWTVFARFRGGKGVGTAAGMLLALYPFAFLICLGIFAAVLFSTRIVSVGSMSAAIALPVVLSVFRYVLQKPIAGSLYGFSFFAAALILFTHRANIKRLLNGTENRFGRKGNRSH